MGNGGSKPGSPGAISPNQALELTRKVNEAQSKTVDNEKRIIELEKIVNDRSQWNQTVRGWIGTEVRIRLVPNMEIRGILKSLDRYTLFVVGHVVSVISADTAANEEEIIIHKGAIVTISQVK